MCFGVWEGTEYSEKAGEEDANTTHGKKVKSHFHFHTTESTQWKEKKKESLQREKSAACVPAGIAPVPPAFLL